MLALVDANYKFLYVEVGANGACMFLPIKGVHSLPEKCASTSRNTITVQQELFLGKAT